MTFPILTILIIMPLLGAFAVSLIPESRDQGRNAFRVALFTSLMTFVLSLWLWIHFDTRITTYQFVEFQTWLPSLGVEYHLGIDGLSLFLILLSTFMTPLCILISGGIKSRLKTYMVSFLVLESFMIGTFASLNLILFYIFFEAVLIPMFLLIGIFGGPGRIYAAFKFFLYTLAGSILMLAGMLYIFGLTGSFDMDFLKGVTFDETTQIWLFLAFFASLAVKIPMFPFHTWLPDAHVEAPTAASVILAGVLLKMGGYGFLRFSLPWFPEASTLFVPLIFGLSVIAVFYASLVALVQTDMKKLIAYSSIAHMGFVTAGIFTLTSAGVEGAIYQMLSHGLVSGALFMCVGVLYDRMHTRLISDYGGVVQKMPLLAVAFLIFTMASLGVPGTSGFVGEALVIFGSFAIAPWLAVGLSFGLILGACYGLKLYGSVMFGPLKSAAVEALYDLKGREVAALLPLILMVFWMGLYPKPFLDILRPYTQNLIKPITYVAEATLV